MHSESEFFDFWFHRCHVLNILRSIVSPCDLQRVEEFSGPECFHCIIDRREFLRGRVACVLSGQTRVYACFLKTLSWPTVSEARNLPPPPPACKISILDLQDAVFIKRGIFLPQQSKGRKTVGKIPSPFVHKKLKRTRNWKNVETRSLHARFSGNLSCDKNVQRDKF